MYLLDKLLLWEILFLAGWSSAPTWPDSPSAVSDPFARLEMLFWLLARQIRTATLLGSI